MPKKYFYESIEYQILIELFPDLIAAVKKDLSQESSE